MSITGSTDLGNGLFVVTVDHDPAAVATDAPAGAIIIDSNGDWYRKLDSGSTTNVSGEQLQKKNKSATTNPTVTDDSDAGYQIFSFWLNTVTEQMFICGDDTAGAAVWTSLHPGSGLKSQFFPVNGNDFVGDFATIVVGANADIYISFNSPQDLGIFVAAKVLLIPTMTASGLDIDLNIDFASAGEVFNFNSASDVVSTYSFTQNEITEIDFTSLLTGIKESDFVGVYIKHNVIGQSVDYLGVLVDFI